jgi:hypothetical protein
MSMYLHLLTGFNNHLHTNQTMNMAIDIYLSTIHFNHIDSHEVLHNLT